MTIRILPDFLINQIAAGEVVERPASVVKELVENAIDAGADEIVIDVQDGGRTSISVMDNGMGMIRTDLLNCINRHATSKLPNDNLLNINYMGFRGEALPSIASVSDMSIDTYNAAEVHGWNLNCNTMEIKPSDWESGTRIRVKNLFSKTPARLKFLRSDKVEFLSVLDVIKSLAMARPDIGFTLNNKYRFPKNQPLMDRIIAVMGDDVENRMLAVCAESLSNNSLNISGFISEPTLRRASSVDEYLFVNNRPVKDKILLTALRAAYMDVMHAREFPLCVLYLNIDVDSVDVNVSPAKTEVHFLEPEHIRAFIIKTLRAVLSKNMLQTDIGNIQYSGTGALMYSDDKFKINKNLFCVCDGGTKSDLHIDNQCEDPSINMQMSAKAIPSNQDFLLGRVIGQIGDKYILAQSGENLVIIDQHAAHERITYEKLKCNSIKLQPLLVPIVVPLQSEDVCVLLSERGEIKKTGLVIDAFGDDAVAIFEKPADWDLDWAVVLKDVATEIRGNGHSSKLLEILHLKLANYACHHSVRAGQKLDLAQMEALLRDIERTEHGGECNHGRPVYKFISLQKIDMWFERL